MVFEEPWSLEMPSGTAVSTPNVVRMDTPGTAGLLTLTLSKSPASCCLIHFGFANGALRSNVF